MGLKINDKYYTIVEFQHVKPGKGGAFVRYKIRDLKSGRVIDQTCNAGTKFENVQLITKEMQYLYNDGATFYFMDNETYEQVELPADFIGDNAKWFKENDNAQLLYADTELLGVQPPMFIEVEITETDPGFKGDTVQGGTKPATVETGAVIQVPALPQRGREDQGRHPRRRQVRRPRLAPGEKSARSEAAPGDRGGLSARWVPGLEPVRRWPAVGFGPRFPLPWADCRFWAAVSAPVGRLSVLDRGFRSRGPAVGFGPLFSIFSPMEGQKRQSRRDEGQKRQSRRDKGQKRQSRRDEGQKRQSRRSRRTASVSRLPRRLGRRTTGILSG